MSETRFQTAGNRITLIRETPSRIPLRKPTLEHVPFADWVSARPEGSGAALAHLLQAAGDDARAADGAAMVQTFEDGADLHPDFVARLNDSEAQSLALPPATKLALDLRSSGLLHKDDFRIDPSWASSGGVPVRASIKDGRLLHEGRDWRIPEPLYSALGEIVAINAANDEAARHAALARLKQAIGEDAAARIRPDGHIDKLRLAYASGFSLALTPSADGVDFDPVLFSRERLGSAEDGAVLDQEADSLLPPQLTQGFARRFRGGTGARRTYLLDDGSLLYIDPQLATALGEVRKAQAGTAEQRRAFAAAPHRHIAEAMAAAGETTGDVRQLFIETQQFSERVAGIDIWRKPVLPWIKPQANSWLPEAFGIRIGDPPEARTLPIPPEEIGTALNAARDAVREQRQAFDFSGESVPATQATLAALESLEELHAQAGSGRAAASPEAEPPPSLSQRYFLQVRDNLEDIAFAPLGKGDEQAAAIIPPESLPPQVTTPPKPHQIDGFRWLASCWLAGQPGALLADDMGLGKTYQALAFLAWVRAQESHARPILIVAPTGLLANWRAEIARHLAPDALGGIVSAYGAELARLREGSGRDTDSGTAGIDPAAWAHAGVVLTTYETMRDYHFSFARQPFAAILYDEAQKLKNPSSQLTRAAKTLNAHFQLALTGTPVENRLQDLWSIFDVIHPGLLGSSKDFEQTYPAQPERLRELHGRLTRGVRSRPAVLLRRLKEECVGSLPAKRVVTMPLPMPPRQAAAYEQVIARALVVRDTGDRGRMLDVLHKLRGVSLHPVAPEDGAGDTGYFADSARLAALFDVLNTVAAQSEKALIFCESLAMQALLSAELQQRYGLRHGIPRIHGGVAGDKRQQLVDEFQKRGPGFDVMLLSPRAGGVGLTITAANHVIHLSRWWNPAVEDQATDRVYRIGQTRDVTVYLPQSIHPDPAIGPASFDLRLHDLIERKRALSRGLLAPGEDDADTGSLFDLVVTEAPDTQAAAAEAPLPSAPAAALAASNPPPSPRRLRERLTLRPRPAAPVPAPEAGPAKPVSPRRVVYEAGGLRERTIFTAPIDGDPVRCLRIIDPYAAAGEFARRNTVNFAQMLLGDGTGVEIVRIETYRADDVNIHRPETNDHQYNNMHDLWDKAFGGKIPLSFVPTSRRGNHEMHDRHVYAQTRSGRSLVWDMGRGIDGVMTSQDRNVVTFTEL